MKCVQIFIDSMLEHAETRFYDPVKAHEYYLKNRELKGREKTKTTDAQREAFAYSKMKIGEARKQDVTSAAAGHQAVVAKARQTAELRRKEIRDKLDVLLKGLSEKATLDSEAAAKKIRMLPPIPKGLPKAETERLQMERSKEIAKIRGDLAKSREAIGSERKGAVVSSRNEAQKVRNEIKTTLDTARSNYETLKKGLKAKYEAATKQEVEAIKQNV